MRAEPLRDACFEESEVVLGPMAGATFLWNPRRLGMALARYKHTAKMLAGLRDVAEIGCADGFCSRVVAQEVGNLYLYDLDEAWVDIARRRCLDFARAVERVDIVEDPLPRRGLDGVYMLDVLEHISPGDETVALANIVMSLRDHGVLVVGTPSAESQQYARALSREGHINCKSGDELRGFLRRFFRNVLVFGINDEMIHTGYFAMCHYLLAYCASPIRIPEASAKIDPLAPSVWDGTFKKETSR